MLDSAGRKTEKRVRILAVRGNSRAQEERGRCAQHSQYSHWHSAGVRVRGHITGSLLQPHSAPFIPVADSRENRDSQEGTGKPMMSSDPKGISAWLSVPMAQGRADILTVTMDKSCL